MIDPDYIAAREIDSNLFEDRVGGEFPHRKGTREGQLETPKQRLFQHGAKNMLTDTRLPPNNITHDLPPPSPPVRQRRAALPAPPPVVTTPSPMSIVQAALASGNVEMYREAVALAKEMDALVARKAFDNAMAAARAEIPVIRKNRRVGFDSRKAGAARTDYAHEDLAEIARTIDPILSSHGLSYRFRVASEVNAPVCVTCVISHRDGHSEETTLRGARDESGNKNGLQAIGSTVTYLQRYTLKAALGLSASADDDGRATEAHVVEAVAVPGTISIDQANELRQMLDNQGISHRAFLQFVRLSRLEDIGIEHFERAKAKIKSFGSKS